MTIYEFTDSVTAKTFNDDIDFKNKLDHHSDYELLLNVRHNIFAYLVVFNIFGIATSFYIDYTFYYISFNIAIGLVISIRYILIGLYNKMYEDRSVLWGRMFNESILFAGIVWGGICLYIWMLYSNSNQWVSMFFIFLTGGITSGSIPAFSPRKNLSIYFTIIILGPVVIWEFMQLTSLSIFTSIAILFYVVMMSILSKSYHHRFVNSFAKDYALLIQTKKLKETKDRFAHLYDFSPVGYLTIDEKDLVKEVNLKAAAMVCRSKESLVGDSIYNVISIDHKQEFELFKKNLLHSKDTQCLEAKIIRNGKESFFARISGVASYSSGVGQVRMTLTKIENKNLISRELGINSQFRLAMMDVSKEKIAEEQLKKAHDELENRVKERTLELASANKILQESEQRYNALFSGINEIVLVHYFPNENHTEKFIEVNNMACDSLGYTEEELKNKDMESISGESSVVEYSQIINELRHRLKLVFEQNLLTSKGKQVLFEMHAHVFDFRGKKAILYTGRDITERKLAYEMMIQSEKIMSISGLAAGMAHEINNPMSGILQGLEVVKNRLTQVIPSNIKAADSTGIEMEKLSAYLDKRGIIKLFNTMHNEGMRAVEIVSNMLSFARKSSTVFSNENITELMNKTISIAKSDYNLKTKFDFRKISIIKNYEDNLPTVACKPGEIQQIFFNVLANGAHAMQDNGSAIDPQFIITIDKYNEKMVRVVIKDNGPGMEEETQAKLFDAFYTTKPPGKGTGLGLYVSNMIVNNHKGEIKVETEQGKGTSFIILLPYKTDRI